MNNVPALRIPTDRVVDMQARLATKYIESPSGCWIWVAAVDGKGYGLVRQPGYKSMRPAHRVAYELAHGEIPAGLHIDHMCRQKKCVNPLHLDAVTNRVNIRRAGNPGHRIVRVLDGRQSRRAPDRVVLSEVGSLLGELLDGKTSNDPMTAVEVLPDVEVDESELLAKPCEVLLWYVGTADRAFPCGELAVGEGMSTCACGHVDSRRLCDEHIQPDDRTTYCLICERDQGHSCRRWRVVTRLYSGRSA